MQLGRFRSSPGLKAEDLETEIDVEEEVAGDGVGEVAGDEEEEVAGDGGGSRRRWMRGSRRR